MKDFKKIGILTFVNVNNYGAELQAFALHHKLKLLGYNNEIINYVFYKNRNYIHEKEANSFIEESKLTKLKDFILKCYDSLSEMLNPDISRTRLKRFNDFHAQYTQLSKEFRRFSDLYREKHSYDTFIVGSDQVWNPNNPINLEPYFLTFAPREAKKISYASSFGVSSIDKKYFSYYKKLLGNLDFVSTREQKGVELIESISQIAALHVLDPTLLLSKEEWSEIANSYEISGNYILLFFFKRSSYVNQLAYEIKKRTGYKIVRICPNEMKMELDSNFLNLRDLGPKEFLGVYKNASIILTSSFHGTVFSLIFEKIFYTITPSSKNNNSRQTSLLSLVGMENRILKEGNSFVDIDLNSIDYEPVRKKIEIEKEKSILYLINAIESEK